MLMVLYGSNLLFEILDGGAFMNPEILDHGYEGHGVELQGMVPTIF